MSQHHATKPAAEAQHTPVDPHYDPAKHPVIVKPEKTNQGAWDVIGKYTAEAEALKTVEDAFVKANKGKASETSLRAAFELKDGNDKDDLADAQRIDRLSAVNKQAISQAPFYAGWLWTKSAEKYGADAVKAAGANMLREANIPGEKARVSPAELGQLTAVTLGQKPRDLTPGK